MSPTRATARVSTVLETAAVWRVRGMELRLGPVPILMGVVNVTPDSFSDGGRYASAERAIARGLALVEAGAAILDVGGESTRPGAEPVPPEEELRRILPVVRGLAERTRVPLSIDTTKLEVARAALESGARIVNDVSALRFAPGIADLAAESGAGLVLMHMRGEPRTMQADPRYGDLLGEIGSELLTAAGAAERAGVERSAIVLDPGIGFGKTAADSYRLIARLEELAANGYPVLVGHSRKSFLDPGRRRDPAERVPESIAGGLLAALGGAAILRVHDVEPHARALSVYDRWLEAMRGSEG
ncbi:MAG TPA: dihydropteroate synthase [Gemmatimonadota bacterium]|nr:dihydropteroate synthase [Gemmatimonadota bacterium]